MPKNKSFSISAVIYSVKLLTLFILFILYNNCIKRDNPWDPLNYNKIVSKCSPDSINAFQDTVKSILHRNMDSLNIIVLAFNYTLFSLDLEKKTRLESNSIILDSNNAIKERNASIEILNNIPKSVDSLEIQTFLDTLVSFPSDFSIKSFFFSYRILDSLKLISLFNSACHDDKDTFEESCWSLFSQSAIPVKAMTDSLMSRKNSYEFENSEILGFNFLILEQNSLIQSYNDSIIKKKWIYRTQAFPHITSGDSIGSGDQLKLLMQNALPGDTFIIEGVFSLGGHWQLSSIHGTASNHIGLLGNPWSSTVLSAQSGIFIDSSEYIDISNITIKGSFGSGLKLENQSNNITLNHCIMEQNNGYGIDISSSGVSLDNCTILNNAKGGIQFVPQPTNFHMNLTNVLIVKNNGFGIDATTPLADLKFVTISNNDSDGIHIVSPINSAISIFNCIISFNKGFGIFRTDVTPNGTINFGLLDLFQNKSDNLSSGIDGSPLNVDPCFSDTGINDFSIRSTGIIYDFQTQQNTIIGYRQ
jgi:hypothetical protein